MMDKRKLTVAILDRMAPPEGIFLLLLAVIIGAVTGLAAVVFIKLIAFIQHSSFSPGSAVYSFLGKTSYVVVPVVGALIAGPLSPGLPRRPKGMAFRRSCRHWS
jgi:CIC family chloride channel protein